MVATNSKPDANFGPVSDHRWLITVGFYVAAALTGVTDALSNNALVYYLSATLLACSAGGWCAADASRSRNPMTWAVQLLTFLFWPIAVPIYLIVSRGWRGLGWLILNAVAVYATICVAYFATVYLYWGPAAFAM
jgi:hypothetical protein